MESHLPWNYIVFNLAMTTLTEQRSIKFTRTNITNFRRVSQMSSSWFICMDQHSHFSISWEHILCYTSCEQQSQCSHHFAFWQEQYMAQDPLRCSLGFGRHVTPSAPRLTAPCSSCSWWTCLCATHNDQATVCLFSTAHNCGHLLLLVVSGLPLQWGCVLGLSGKVLIVGRLQGRLLREAVRSFTHFQ